MRKTFRIRNLLVDNFWEFDDISRICICSHLQVILGLIFPPFIKRLDFKSKEELQQMPQTEEEHLENQNLDYEDQEKQQHPDAEVLSFIHIKIIHLV